MGWDEFWRSGGSGKAARRREYLKGFKSYRRQMKSGMSILPHRGRVTDKHRVGMEVVYFPYSHGMIIHNT